MCSEITAAYFSSSSLHWHQHVLPPAGLRFSDNKEISFYIKLCCPHTPLPLENASNIVNSCNVRCDKCVQFWLISNMHTCWNLQLYIKWFIFHQVSEKIKCSSTIICFVWYSAAFRGSLDHPLQRRCSDSVFLLLLWQRSFCLARKLGAECPPFSFWHYQAAKRLLRGHHSKIPAPPWRWRWGKKLCFNGCRSTEKSSRVWQQSSFSSAHLLPLPNRCSGDEEVYTDGPGPVNQTSMIFAHCVEYFQKCHF